MHTTRKAPSSVFIHALTSPSTISPNFRTRDDTVSKRPRCAWRTDLTKPRLGFAFTVGTLRGEVASNLLTRGTVFGQGLNALKNRPLLQLGLPIPKIRVYRFTPALPRVDRVATCASTHPNRPVSL